MFPSKRNVDYNLVHTTNEATLSSLFKEHLRRSDKKDLPKLALKLIKVSSSSLQQCSVLLILLHNLHPSQGNS